VVKRPILERGDIVLVDLNPATGRELRNAERRPRPALVLSRAEFNRMGTVLVAPITQGGELARVAGFAATLSGSGTQIQGAVLVSAIRMLDLEARGARRIERAPDSVIDDALARLQAILD
jgi:mRNA interferase ChpB